MRTLYQPKQEDLNLSTLFYALSDQIRLDIVKKLADTGEHSCGELHIPGPNSTISHHFKVLRESGLTNTRLEGNQRFISLRCDDLNARFPGLLQSVLTGLEK